MRRLAPIRENDALDAPTFLARHPPAHLSLTLTYRCRNRHEVGLPM